MVSGRGSEGCRKGLGRFQKCRKDLGRGSWDEGGWSGCVKRALVLVQRGM